MKRRRREIAYEVSPVQRFRNSIQSASNTPLGFKTYEDLDESKLVLWKNILQEAVGRFNFWWRRIGKNQTPEGYKREWETRATPMTGTALENHFKGVFINFLKMVIKYNSVRCSVDRLDSRNVSMVINELGVSKINFDTTYGRFLSRDLYDYIEYLDEVARKIDYSQAKDVTVNPVINYMNKVINLTNT